MNPLFFLVIVLIAAAVCALALIVDTLQRSAGRVPVTVHLSGPLSDDPPHRAS